MLGRTLGHYEIREELGRGGMGEVYRAFDTTLGREVAIKVLPAHCADEPDRLERFRREARVVASLSHPNIVTLFSVEEADGIHFLTMELVEGENLARSIPRHGLALARFFRLAIPIADALAAAEDRGIAHRDLKPGNIMVADSGAVKLLDFGLARLFEAPQPAAESVLTTDFQTSEGRVLGTLPYMSPEHVHGHPVDHRSDIFSFGVVLYQMATGELPFAGSTSAELISSILRDEPSGLTEVVADRPRHLARIVRRCLEKDPERRYQTAKDLRNDLEELEREISHDEILASADTTNRRSVDRRSVDRRRPRTRPRRGAVAAALGLAAVVAIAAFAWLALRGDQAPPGRGTVDLAVLPFTDHSADPRWGHLVEGVSTGLTTRLSELTNVRLADRAAAARLAEKGLPTTEVARRLGVSLVLEGDVNERDGRLEVVPRLVDGTTGIVVWSRPETGDPDDPLALERSLARQLADVLEIRVSERERRRMESDPTASLKAYEYYVKGRQRLADRDARPEFAAASFRNAVRLDAGFALAHAGLAEALRLLYLRDGDPGVLAEAESEAERAVELDPALPAALMARALLLRTTGRLDASIGELEPLLAGHPKPGEAYRQLAFSYSEAGDPEMALTCFEAAVERDPEEWSAWNSLGVQRLRMGDYAGAREAFDRAVPLLPPGVNWPQQNLATVALYEGDFAGAVAAYEKIAGATLDVDLLSNIGTAYFFLDRLEESERAYRLAVELEPANDVSHRNLADLYVRQGRMELARNEYREALALVESRLEDSPDHLRSRLLQALYAAKADDCDRALDLADRLDGDLEADLEAHHQIAQTRAVCDDRAGALAALERAFALGLSPKLVLEEDEFRTLHDDPEFQRLTAESVPTATTP